MIHLLRGTLSRLLALGVIALVLVAVLITAVRFALPAAGQYRERVAKVLSERLGYPVRMGSLSVGLTGWTPRLTLNHVALGDPEGGPDVLSLQALALDLDLPASLRLGSPQVRALTLVGARLALRRLADGRIRVLGLGAIQSDDPRPLELFLRQGRFILVDGEISLIDERSARELPRLTEVHLRLINEGQIHRVELRARPRPRAPSDPGVPFEGTSMASVGRAAGADLGTGPGDVELRLLADLRGDSVDPATWGGQVYLALSGADALALVPPTVLRPGRTGAEALALEAWLRLSGGRLVDALGRLALGGLRLNLTRSDAGRDPGSEGSPAAAPPPRADEILAEHLSALARLTPTREGWRLGVRDLSLAMGGAGIAGLDLDLALSPRGHLESLAAGAESLDLALLRPLARLDGGILPQMVRDLASRDPRGRLARIALRLERPPSRPPTWRLSAQGQEVGVARGGHVPGFQGLGFSLDSDQDGGELRLLSEGLQLDLAPRLDRSLSFDRLSGRLAWTLGPGGALHLTGRELVLENPDLAGRARLRLDLPAPGGTDVGSGPFLDLRARLEDGDGARARTYLPVGILKPKLVHWLERALVGGRIPQADLVVRGPLRDFPFREHQGRFELLLEIEDGGLNYLEAWPPIEGATGVVHFLNQGMEVRIESARILDSAITAGRAAIPDLWSARRLSVEGDVEGPLSDGLRILGETPLAARLGPLSQSLEVAGVAHLTLDLEVPLRPGEPLGLDGRLGWPGPAQVALKGTPLILTDLTGELRFTKRALTAESIGARLWGRPLTFEIATRETADPEAAVTEVLARFRMPLRDLAERLPSPLWSLAQGEAAWDLGLELATADLRLAHSTLRWRLGSDLQGVALDLPPPLGKRANQARPLELQGALLPGRSLGVHGDLGELGLDLVLDLTEASPRLERGRVALGAKTPAGGGPAPIPEGLRVEGTLSELDLPTWGAWWSRVWASQGGQGRGDNPVPILGTRPLALDLSIARLGVGKIALTDARVRSATRSSGWTLEIDSRELGGELDVPAPGSNAPLGLRLAWLDLASFMPPEGSEGPTSAPGSRGDLSRLPSADLRVEDLRWADQGLGRLTLELRPEPSALRVPRIELQGPGSTRVHGEATWLDGPEGGRTRLALDLESADLGPLVRALDYKSAFSEAPVESSIRLEWPGEPGAFALARSGGTIDLEVGPGRLLEVEPGVGRVLGILNLGALGRRLSLDFSDLYAQGFSFERILGDIQIGDGRAQLRRFEIEGPSSTIRVNGFTDLRTRTFDQTVTVEPRIGSSVALASALAGGPVVGAAVYLADKVSGGTIDKLGSYRYRVTGPWTDPELTRLGWDPFARQGAPQTGGASGPALPSLPPVRPGENHFLD